MLPAAAAGDIGAFLVQIGAFQAIAMLKSLAPKVRADRPCAVSLILFNANMSCWGKVLTGRSFPML
jgi:hypothetical protein